MDTKLTVCKNAEALLKFLYQIDKTLPVPLSERVDMEKFASDSVQNFVYTVEQDGQIVCAALFYFHFLNQPFAYFDLIATVPGYEGRGYARFLMDAAEETAQKAGMTEFHLHTNDTNTAALSLYGKRGYEIIAHDPKVHMKKEL
jgi:ribosomal protein S18 acetylase RimI-like enzyme